MTAEKKVSPEVVRAMIERNIEEAGGVRALARKWKISAAHVSDVRHGRRDLGGALMRRHLGIKKRIVREVIYEQA